MASPEVRVQDLQGCNVTAGTLDEMTPACNPVMQYSTSSSPEVRVQDLQALGGIIVSVEPEAAVAGVVVARVEVLELLICELRDDLRVTSRVVAVRVVREQCLARRGRDEQIMKEQWVRVWLQADA
jgi:hypothetical protein